MPGLDTDIVVHRLPLREGCASVKQKLRRVKPEMLLKIKEKVKKQLDAGFLEVAKYPQWVANIVTSCQRAMVTLFHDMMHKEIEVYVDDMIAKSQGEDDHVVNLKKLFERLRKFQLKLNPVKCTFGATSEKLLGFVVSKKRIEIDPKKVRAIQDLPPPRT